ncbi:hypothetical protein CERSUDRAFT_75269 [Gelatoporia subvermispora B]|uniref:Uncharacterized protein n=1 Tax=Ceriporiopsis subvermispora (strain B) TaxID=914234 RepID=M2QD31_CERS8|nr:hypothetical protein CERSUDRAFT_75269 [Gelatoporia subvermispora B]
MLPQDKTYPHAKLQNSAIQQQGHSLRSSVVPMLPQDGGHPHAMLQDLAIQQQEPPPQSSLVSSLVPTCPTQGQTRTRQLITESPAETPPSISAAPTSTAHAGNRPLGSTSTGSARARYLKSRPTFQPYPSSRSRRPTLSDASTERTNPSASSMDSSQARCPSVYISSMTSPAISHPARRIMEGSAESTHDRGDELSSTSGGPLLAQSPADERDPTLPNNPSTFGWPKNNRSNHLWRDNPIRPGKWIMYRSTRDGTRMFWLIPMTGGSEIRESDGVLLKPNLWRPVRWYEDGKPILDVAPDDCWIKNGKEKTPLAREPVKIRWTSPRNRAEGKPNIPSPKPSYIWVADIGEAVDPCQLGEQHLLSPYYEIAKEWLDEIHADMVYWKSRNATRPESSHPRDWPDFYRKRIFPD